MGKILTKIVLMLGLIFVNLFCCSFFQITLAVDILYVPDEELEDKLESKHDADTPDYLQYAASNSRDAYFSFNASKMVKNSKKIDIYGNDLPNYNYNSKSVICISPADHNVAKTQIIECIMDVLEDKVVVYKKNADGDVKVTETKRATTDSTKVKALEYADQLAYFAYKSVKANETDTPKNFRSYKCIMRFQVYRKTISIF